MHRHKLLRNPLILILAISVAPRIAAALYMGNQVVAVPGSAEKESYHSLALRVSDGLGFSIGENWWPLTRAVALTALEFAGSAAVWPCYLAAVRRNDTGGRGRALLDQLSQSPG